MKKHLRCLSFMSLAASSPSALPPPIEALIKNRIQQQWSQIEPDIPLNFDDASCAQKGTYSYQSSSLILQADSVAWRGQLELGTSNLIEGARIPFEIVHFKISAPPSSEVVMPTEPQKPRTHWLPWVIGAGIAALGLGLWKWHRSSNHGQRSKDPRSYPLLVEDPSGSF